MPAIYVATNVSSSKLKKDLNLHLWNVLGDLLDKPNEAGIVNIREDQNISFDGTDEPCALIILESAESMPPKETQEYMIELEDHLHISPTRMYILFREPKKHEIEINKTTFE